MKKPHLLLVNPWIFDFAAFDLWLKPLGLLYIADILLKNSYEISFIDCLDRNNEKLLKLQKLDKPKNKKYGCGNFFRSEVKKPEILRDIPKKYCRYGITEERFIEELKKIKKPDAILVTSTMTYWYPGVFRAIEILKDNFKNVPVILGGIYATLCHEHALKFSGADFVFKGSNLNEIIKLISGMAKSNISFILSIDEFPSPAFSLYKRLDYACILTSYGCPFNCTYCASRILHKSFIQIKPEKIISEIGNLHKNFGINNFAFYDDALLVNPVNHLENIMDGINKLDISCYFHTPNGLHPKYITESLAEKMYSAGFKTLRLSLETADMELQKITGGKVTNDEFEKAVGFLKKTGFTSKELGAYIFIGHPNQTKNDVMNSISYVIKNGVMPFIVEYSPIPGTVEWNNLVKKGIIEENIDPLLHNNSVFFRKFFRWEEADLQKAKSVIKAYLNA